MSGSAYILLFINIGIEFKPYLSASLTLFYNIGRTTAVKLTASIPYPFDIGRIPPNKSTATIRKFLDIGRISFHLCIILRYPEIYITVYPSAISNLIYFANLSFYYFCESESHLAISIILIPSCWLSSCFVLAISNFG